MCVVVLAGWWFLAGRAVNVENDQAGPVPTSSSEPPLRLEAIGSVTAIAGGVQSMLYDPSGLPVYGPPVPGLLTLSVERLVYDGGAPIDLPFGPGARFALLVSPLEGSGRSDDTWGAATLLVEKPEWLAGDRPVYSVEPDPDSAFAKARIETPTTLVPTSARSLGLVFTTPADSEAVGLALIDDDDRILTAVSLK